MEGSGRGLIGGIIPEFVWKDWGQPRLLLVRVVGVWAEIWARILPNMKQEC
jgi:hypothetical protein